MTLSMHILDFRATQRATSGIRSTSPSTKIDCPHGCALHVRRPMGAPPPTQIAQESICGLLFRAPSQFSWSADIPKRDPRQPFSEFQSPSPYRCTQSISLHLHWVRALISLTLHILVTECRVRCQQNRTLAELELGFGCREGVLCARFQSRFRSRGSLFENNIEICVNRWSFGVCKRAGSEATVLRSGVIISKVAGFDQSLFIST